MKGELSIRKAVPGKGLKKKKQGNDYYVECLNFDLSRVAELVHHALVSSDNDSLVTKDCSDCKGLVEKEPAFMDKFFAHHLPATMVILSVREAKTMFKRDLLNLIEGKPFFEINSVIRRELPESALGWPLLQRTNRPALEALRSSEVRTMSLVEWNSKENNSSSDLKTDDCIVKKCKTEGTVIQLFHASETESRDGSSNREHENFGFKQKVSSNFDFLHTKESTRSGPGWLLFRIKTSASPESLQESQADGLSVVQWVLSLPNRSEEATTNIQIDVVSKEAESYVENNICGHEDKHSEACLAASMKLPKKLGCFFKLCSSGCKQFSYEELRRETHHFSSQVAVKILKHYKEARNDFSLEVDIMSSLKHKHITPRIGICVEDDHLILVYDFLSKGSLEERLQGNSRKSVLPWKVRFKMAIEIAETLNHLHNERPQPVIHRDIKSSNILLSNHFQPQLMQHIMMLLELFGYIAPEYFMYGRVSDKIDVYSYGIVRLELLTGKKPIISTGLKEQENLVKWPAGNAIIRERESKSFAGPEDGQRDFDIVQMQRIVVAATLCVGQTARVRPKLELLRGEKGERDWVNSYANDLKKSSDEEFDDLFLEFGCKPCVGAFISGIR
eukprot:XP_024457608.1 receptor-like serine/threonine-protein kinase At3g01300 [Populus trichocarpa]